MQLKPGYDGVPQLLAAFEKGIPHKVAADTAGQLVFFGYTEVGERPLASVLWSVCDCVCSAWCAFHARDGRQPWPSRRVQAQGVLLGLARGREPALQRRESKQGSRRRRPPCASARPLTAHNPQACSTR